jgi:tRNA (guanine-N7-)-methyltransferase
MFKSEFIDEEMTLREDIEIMASTVSAVRRVSNRLRSHANCWSHDHQQPIPLPLLTFERAERPLILDVGCGRGAYLREVALRHSDSHNVLGIDIRRQAIDSAIASLQSTANANALYANVLCDQHLSALMQLIAPRLDVALVLFPDPMFKSRHRKRRAFGDAVLAAFAAAPRNVTIVFKSDVEDVYLDARQMLLEHSADWTVLDESAALAETLRWLGPIRTTRETLVHSYSGQVFRFVATRRRA